MSDTQPPADTPKPGSDAAIDAGCICAVLDNNHGHGTPCSDGKVAYWLTAGCPLHDPTPSTEPTDEA
jgi:hypothetical protein